MSRRVFPDNYLFLKYMGIMATNAAYVRAFALHY